MADPDGMLSFSIAARAQGDTVEARHLKNHQENPCALIVWSFGLSTP